MFLLIRSARFTGGFVESIEIWFSLKRMHGSLLCEVTIFTSNEGDTDALVVSSALPALFFSASLGGESLGIFSVQSSPDSNLKTPLVSQVSSSTSTEWE